MTVLVGEVYQRKWRLCWRRQLFLWGTGYFFKTSRLLTTRTQPFSFICADFIFSLSTFQTSSKGCLSTEGRLSVYRGLSAYRCQPVRQAKPELIEDGKANATQSVAARKGTAILVRWAT